ncbi:MAG: ABC transporter permease [Planctomycetota bacterium]
MIRATVRTMRLGVKSLLLHKLRSFLSMLGLLCGVAAVISMLAIGEGQSQADIEGIKALGSTNILIRSKKPPATEGSSSGAFWEVTRHGLTYRDVEGLVATLGAADEIVQVKENPAELRSGREWTTTTVIGTEPTFLGVAGMSLAEGRWITNLDSQRQENVCVLGGSLVQDLYPLDQPLGSTIRIDKDRYTVIGVLETLGRTSGSAGPNLDDCAFVPMGTARARFGDIQTQRGSGSFSREHVELHEIRVAMSSTEGVEPAARVIRRYIEDNHGGKNDYAITVPLELIRQTETRRRKWKFMLAAMAGISLLVGGIGIMNVMLATVTERTREIGIRRALGAKKANIIHQFVVETGVLSTFGGLFGVLVGLAAPSLVIEKIYEEPTVVLPEHVILAFSISAAVGILFGIYPAYRAAAMDPVEALRHE